MAVSRFGAVAVFLTRSNEMADKIITIRDAIPTSAPSGQSFVADWSTFSKGGAGVSEDPGTLQGDGSRDNDAETGITVGTGTGTDTDTDTDPDPDFGASATSEDESDAPAFGGDSSAAPVSAPQDAGFLSRVMNPFRSRATNDDTVDAAMVADNDATQSPGSQKINAARELVAAIESVTRSSSGDSIADLLDQIATSLRGIEVATRALSRPSGQPNPQWQGRQRDRDGPDRARGQQPQVQPPQGQAPQGAPDRQDRNDYE